MFGAIRPSWIDKEMFYRMPFNFCDRWCERCNLISICRVYKDLYKTRKRFLKKGKDPDSLESAMEIIGENFEKVRKLIKKDAKKWGIDLENFPESEIEEERSFEEELQRYPLYKLATNYAKKIENLLEELSPIALESHEKVIENLEIINYYQEILPAKIYRACISREEEDEMENDTTMDSQTSAFIAIRGLRLIIFSLTNLLVYPYLKPSKKKIINLIGISEDLIDLLTKKFIPKEQSTALIPDYRN